MSDGCEGSFSTVGPSFNISDETRRECPLRCASVSVSSLLFLYLLSHSTFPSIISHFSPQPFPPLFGPIIFLFALLLLPSVYASSFIYCGIISHLRSVLFLAFIFASRAHTLPFLYEPPAPPPLFFLHIFTYACPWEELIVSLLET